MKRWIAAVMAGIFCLTCFPMICGAAEENLALGKPVTASSKYTNDNSMAPENVNNGSHDDYWARGQYTLAGKVKGCDFITIDLQDEYVIDSVVVYNRNDLRDDQYRKNVALEFSKTADFANYERIQIMDDTPAPFGVPVSVDPGFKKSFRYVRAIKTDDVIFVLAEIEIYGHIGGQEGTVSYDDTVGMECSGPAVLLGNMGIMSGVDEETFGPQMLLTRAQAAELVVRAFGQLGVGENVSIFQDVPSNHPYASAIADAYKMGYIGGSDGLFRPDDYITLEEVYSIVLNALGYRPYVAARGAFTDAVRQTAKEAELTKNMPKDFSAHVNRASMATLLYNGLRAPVLRIKGEGNGLKRYEQGECLLSSRYGYEITEGVVSEISDTTLEGMPKEKDRRAKVGEKVLDDPNGKFDNYLGQYAYVVYRQEDNAIIAQWTDWRNQTVKIDARDLDTTETDIRGGRLRAWSDSKIKSYPLSSEVDVIYNGISYPAFQPADLLVESGELCLLDNNWDGKYEVVFVNTYTLRYVNSAAENGEQLTIVFSDGTQEKFDLETLTVSGVNGAAKRLASVKGGTVVKIYRAPDDRKTVITVLDSPVTGAVTTIAEDFIAIDGEKYQLERAGSAQEHQLGDVVSAFCDSSGRIIWIEAGSQFSEDWNIGFAQKTAIGIEGFSTPRMRIFAQDNAFHIYSLADKIELDGVKISADNFHEYLTQRPEAYQFNFVRYKLNTQGEISKLDSTYYDPLTEEEDSFRMGKPIVGGAYIPEAEAFYQEHEFMCLVNPDAYAFRIPVVDGQYTSDSNYDYAYRVSKGISSLNVSYNYEPTRTINQYQTDEFGCSACYARLVAVSGSGDGRISTVDSPDAPFLLIEAVGEALVDDETGVMVSGYNLKTGNQEQLMLEREQLAVESGLIYQQRQQWLKKDEQYYINAEKLEDLSDEDRDTYLEPVSGLAFGDVIRYQKDELGAVQAIERVYHYTAGGMPTQTQSAWLNVNGNYPDWFWSANRFQLATVKQITKKTVEFRTATDKSEVFHSSQINNVIVVNEERGRLEKESNLTSYIGDGYYVLTLCCAGKPRIAIVYPNR